VAVVTGAGLLKETLLEVLNAEARSLGLPPITDRMLRDWIVEDLLPGPTEKGLGRGSGSEWRSEDLGSEFRRLLHRRFFRNPFGYDARSGDDLTEREMERELRKAGPLDQRLAEAGLAPPSGDVLNFTSELVWGSPESSQILKSFDGLISQFASEKGRGIFAVLLVTLSPTSP
jgi:hypothetical protein